MHKLIEYIDNSMKEYEDKVARGGELSYKDIECLKDLAKTKMAILTNEAMENESYEYSREGDMHDGRYSRTGRGRGTYAKRDSMGRYSRRYDAYSYADAKQDMIMELKELAQKAPDEKTKQEIEHFANEMESK